MNKSNLLITAALALLGTGAQAAVIDFDDNLLAPDSYFDPQANTTWTSGGASFTHSWNDTFNCCWGGFTYSNAEDTTTPGFFNDRSAITGDGAGAGQDNYAVGTVGAGNPQLQFGQALTVQGAYFTNVTYTYLAIANGDDGNTPAFVKGPFAEGDFLELTVTGLDAVGAALSSTSFLLADGASIIDAWTWFDLSVLGNVHGLEFSLASSDNGAFGMNTPGYFAVDDISVVPLPAAVWLFASALGVLGWGRRARVR